MIDDLFAWSRTPMYLGLTIALAGIAIGLRTISPWLGPVIFAGVVDRTRFGEHRRTASLIDRPAHRDRMKAASFTPTDHPVAKDANDANDAAESSIPYVASGAVLFGVSGWLTYRMFDGLGRAHDAIEQFEIIHGPLLDDSGRIDRFGPPGPIAQLTDEVSSVAGFFYPLGSALVIPLLILWAVSSLLLFIERRRWGFVLFGLIAIGVIAGAASFSGTYQPLLEILE